MLLLSWNVKIDGGLPLVEKSEDPCCRGCFMKSSTKENRAIHYCCALYYNDVFDFKYFIL